jgi:hypothetical protein
MQPGRASDREEPHERAARPRRWLALLGAAFFMVILDGTIVYVALPSIEEDLGFAAGAARESLAGATTAAQQLPDQLAAALLTPTTVFGHKHEEVPVQPQPKVPLPGWN